MKAQIFSNKQRATLDVSMTTQHKHFQTTPLQRQQRGVMFLASIKAVQLW